MAIINFRRPLVLATASPARRELVANTGLSFIPDSVEIDETPLSGEAIGAYVGRVARMKAEAVVPPSLDAVIVSVDTTIGLNGMIIGKPENEAHAREILSRLSGRTHEVLSSIALRDVEKAAIQIETTRTEIKFCRLAKEVVEWYISTGEWKGRAGAYAIQGKGAALVEKVEGCFTNVIGISIPSLLDLLKKI